ncbi:Rv3654c family TadE-like protein [Brachybacterium squillarum]|uniref:Rv3654c family TadE-like protein n=1 Tax=Brachybacterium squillarum TaxID=661979 RepID=UPI0022213F61|nr:Rv3654c family TadE-like protein [Brachybacterium squillarum]MCW1804225.1 flp pilus-assembly TadE/G-like family protein [Brachybacterium squillarum]
MSTGAAGVLAWTGAMTTAVAGLTLLGAGLLAQSRAETAADLASLAGADSLAAASGDPCTVAGEAAARNEARLVSCEVQGWDVMVRVEVDAAPLGAMGARSRAGPGPAELP